MRTVARVYPQVLAEVGVAAEGFPAVPAAEGARARVHDGVFAQVRAPAERARALAARVRPRARVHVPRVSSLTRALGEHQSARAAAVGRALVVLRALVLSAARALGVGAVAVLAHEHGAGRAGGRTDEGAGGRTGGRTGGGLLGLAGRTVQTGIHHQHLGGALAREAPQLGRRGEAARAKLDALLSLVQTAVADASRQAVVRQDLEIFHTTLFKQTIFSLVFVLCSLILIAINKHTIDRPDTGQSIEYTRKATTRLVDKTRLKVRPGTETDLLLGLVSTDTDCNELNTICEG